MASTVRVIIDFRDSHGVALYRSDEELVLGDEDTININFDNVKIITDPLGMVIPIKVSIT